MEHRYSETDVAEQLEIQIAPSVMDGVVGRMAAALESGERAEAANQLTKFITDLCRIWNVEARIMFDERAANIHADWQKDATVFCQQAIDDARAKWIAGEEG